MAQQNARYTRTPQSEKLKWVDSMVHLMDNQFRLPGTRYRFGLDPVLGLFPFVGDFVSFAISAGLVMTMARHGASGKVVALMLLNIAVDVLFGSIPVLGNIFDFAFKANQRNVRLLREHYEQGKHQGSGKGIIVGVLLMLIVLVVFIVWALWQLATYIIALF
ncbi:DUF4112 domain-containing protein [Pontibacter sp. SGAir0037]|uniref:DUF4112 domain-containing protein n=1 Tax=Pontibacter sp. SGAir0037 TaxID=2571030 RepID=UPI0010CD6621|nr:DUF4112 domain-containing protein [Pontibacter sp. SGAir0037]QCR23575.1 DUF4112 domain-containing protein [Pontibacter sp. SGAir0037]